MWRPQLPTWRPASRTARPGVYPGELAVVLLLISQEPQQVRRGRGRPWAGSAEESVGVGGAAQVLGARREVDRQGDVPLGLDAAGPVVAAARVGVAPEQLLVQPGHARTAARGGLGGPGRDD